MFPNFKVSHVIKDGGENWLLTPQAESSDLQIYALVSFHALLMQATNKPNLELLAKQAIEAAQVLQKLMPK